MTAKRQEELTVSRFARFGGGEGKPTIDFRSNRCSPKAINIPHLSSFASQAIPDSDPDLSLMSSALQFDSTNFEYFPPTNSLSENGYVKPIPLPSTMSANVVPNAAAPPPQAPTATTAPGSGAAAPSKVTLHLGHLPRKTDIKGAWPRTPTRVYSFDVHMHFI